MDWFNLHSVLVFIQHVVSLIGILTIASGVLIASARYLYFVFTGQISGKQGAHLNVIRLDLGRVLILGLEFIVAGDLIGTTTTPDYYEVGLLAIIVVIRTILSFSINKELMSIKKE